MAEAAFCAATLRWSRVKTAAKTVFTKAVRRLFNLLHADRCQPTHSSVRLGSAQREASSAGETDRAVGGARRWLRRVVAGRPPQSRRARRRLPGCLSRLVHATYGRPRASASTVSGKFVSSGGGQWPLQQPLRRLTMSGAYSQTWATHWRSWAESLWQCGTTSARRATSTC